MKINFVFLIIFVISSMQSLSQDVIEYKTRNDSIVPHINCSIPSNNLFDVLDSMNMTFNLINDSINEESLSNLDNYKVLHDTAIINFLCNIDIINQWDIIQSLMESFKDIPEIIKPEFNNRDKEIERCANTALYYCGKLNISKYFDSYLILSNAVGKLLSDSFNYLYLINIKDNIIKSITNIAIYTTFDGPITKIAILPNKTFYKNDLLWNDVRFDEESLRESGELDDIPKPYNYDYDVFYSEFYFDDDGYLHFKQE
ncbi:MAG: hypothetical protein LBL74_00905 [Bacteroidales bacterium]|jgi:hypothetical protein|nr:hypothetical protein [Bacteroidales bacterium]